MLPKNNRGQIGTTMTWLVASVIIIVILMVSIFVSSVYSGGTKKISSFKTDILASKSFYSYLLTKNSDGKTIYEQMRGEENLNDFNGNLGLQIFKGFYEKDYNWGIWLGVVNKQEAVENSFFGFRPENVRNSPIAAGRSGILPVDNYIDEKIKLGENKEAELILMEK